MHRNVAKGRTRRLVGLAVVVLLTCMVLSSCESGRVGARCRGTGWGDDGGAWILRCQKGRWVRALTKHDYAKIVLASQPAPTAPPTTGAPATSPPTTAPPTAPAPLGGIGSVVSGGSFVCAVTAERQVRCWGYNTDGGLASGPVNSTFRPLASLVPGVANVLELTAGAGHACALISGGTVTCWGLNNAGQLGTPTTLGGQAHAPGTVPGLSDVVAISAGSYFTCALLSNGTARCWGSNAQGELGNGTTAVDQPTPQVVLGLQNLVALDAGAYSSCALNDVGAVWCWGPNLVGQLGNGTTANATSPVAVLGLHDAVAISSGDSHACARRAGGTVACWGQGHLLGGYTSAGSLVPQQVTSVAGDGADLTGSASLSTGNTNTCSVGSDGGLTCWGVWMFPRIVEGLPAVTGATDDGYRCAVTAGDGRVLCWDFTGTGVSGLTVVSTG